MKPGIYPGLSYDDYAALGGHRASSLWPLVRQTPAHYQRRLMAPSAPTEAMVFGTALHTFVLEPLRFEATYSIGGPINPRTGKAYGRDTKAWETWAINHPDLEVISEEDMERLNRIKAALDAHDVAPAILQADGWEREASAIWEDPGGAGLMQARFDLLQRGVPAFADLKSTRDASPREFARSAEAIGYFMQAAIYWDGLRELTAEEPASPIVIPCETQEPFLVAVYEIGDEEIAHGREQYKHALARLAWCKEHDEWTGYPGVMSLSPPKWAVERPVSIIE